MSKPTYHESSTRGNDSSLGSKRVLLKRTIFAKEEQLNASHTSRQKHKQSRAVHTGKLAAIVAVLLLISMRLAAPMQAASGDLDPTFGIGGKTTTDFFGSVDAGRAMAVQQDGKILVAGFTLTSSGGTTDFAVARYTSAGALDPGFGPGGTGKVITDFFGSMDSASALAIQCDGKIIAAGNASNPASSDVDFALACYNRNGVLDTSFGSSATGKVTTDFSGNFDVISAMALQSNGNIVAAGSAGSNFTNSDFALARYTGDVADLLITKTASTDLAVAGGTITYTINVTNRGPNAVTQVNVRDVLPPELTFVSSSTSGAPSICNAGPGNDRRCALGPVAAGASVTVTIVATVNSSISVAAITNTATVSSCTFDPDLSDNASTVTTRVASIECLQDDGSDDFISFNLITGDYTFTKCGASGFVLSGSGEVITKSCLIALRDTESDRRLLAQIDTCTNRGKASLQLFSPSMKLTIIDRNTADNSCACAAAIEALPDLVPIPGPSGFCQLDPTTGKLIVRVKNQGTAFAPAFVVEVRFPAGAGFPGAQIFLTSMGLLPGESRSIEPVDFPAGCFNSDCDFTITVDPADGIQESDEGNNFAAGSCIG